MVKLVETHNVKLGRRITAVSANGEWLQNFVEIPAIGDGNCAFNAAGLLIIDLILRDKFNRAHFDKLKEALAATVMTLEKRLALYREQASPLTGNAYTDLAQPLEEFIDFICTKDRSWNEFSAYIKSQTTREQIAALHVGLQPALRALGTDEIDQHYQKNLKVDDFTEIAQDVNNQKQDGEEADEPMVRGVGIALGININIYHDINGSICHPMGNKENDADASLLHVSGHWNFITPVNQTNGLARALSSAPIAAAEAEVVQPADAQEAEVTESSDDTTQEEEVIESPAVQADNSESQAATIAKPLSIEVIIDQRSKGYEAALFTFNQFNQTLFKSVDDLQANINKLKGSQQDEAKGLLEAIRLQNEEIDNRPSPRKSK